MCTSHTHMYICILDDVISDHLSIIYVCTYVRMNGSLDFIVALYANFLSGTELCATGTQLQVCGGARFIVMYSKYI